MHLNSYNTEFPKFTRYAINFKKTGSIKHFNQVVYLVNPVNFVL